jgi:class 3 adenylate cyclase
LGLLSGTIGQKAIFLALVAIYAMALALSAHDKLVRVGQPDVGWVANIGGTLSPSRRDASEMGLRGGGRALAINGIEVTPFDFERQSPKLTDRKPGASNTIRFQRWGRVQELTIPVRDWTWRDAIFTYGIIDALALLFMATALTSFALRPYEATSWAILSLASFSGALLTASLLQDSFFQGAYISALSGAIPAAILHAALAFPVANTWLFRSSTFLVLYGLGALNGLLQVGAWSLGWWGPFRHIATLSIFMMFASVIAFILRSGTLSLRSRDSLVAQRARILLVAAILGAGPPVLAGALHATTSWFAIDMRLGYWALAFFFVPLGFVSVRQSLVNARAAARRAVILAAVAALLTAVGLVLVAVQAYALSLLLFPLLYWWPRFERRLAARIYPTRARFPELLQELGAEMASRRTVEELLDVLASAPARLCGARSAVAFLLPGAAGPDELVRVTDDLPFDHSPPIASETLVKLMETTRHEVLRDQIAVEPQFANIEADCHGGFDRFGAELLLPILRENQVIGGLATGAPNSGDPYEPAEITALTSATHQMVQALSRVDALARLRARESEFGELKRFFSPHVIDQIMERGGAKELRTGRKLVTVFFADLRGFTSFSEGVEPEDVMATLAEYHNRMGARISEYGGTLERFAGDGFMVFFNDPVEQPDHVSRAARMALAMRADLLELQQRWRARGHDIDAGMGVHTGYATVGFVGYEGRRDYAVIGNVTNLAARLSDAAAGGEVLVSAGVRTELEESVPSEPAGTLELKGISRPQQVFRLLAGGRAEALVT